MQCSDEANSRSRRVRSSGASGLQVDQQVSHSRKEFGAETDLRQEFEQARGQLLQEHLREQYETQRQHTEEKRKFEDRQSLRRNTEIVCQAQEMAGLRVVQIGRRMSSEEKAEATKEPKARHSQQKRKTEYVMRSELAQCEDRLQNQWNILLLKQAHELDGLQSELQSNMKRMVEKE